MDGYHTKEMRRQGSRVVSYHSSRKEMEEERPSFHSSRSPESAILFFKKLSLNNSWDEILFVGSSSDDSHVYYFNIFVKLRRRKKEEEFYSRIEWDSTLPLPYKSPSRRGGDGRGIDPRQSGSCALYTGLERALPVLLIYM